MALDAKNVPFTQSGAGLAMAGITPQNMYARLDKLRLNSTSKEGGNAQLWKNLGRWTTTPNAGGLNPQQASLFNQYYKTGVRPAGLTDQTVSGALDWGLREGGRSQQHKNTFWDSAFGQLLGPALTIGSSFLPGGQFLAPAVGALTGGLKGGWSGAVLGGLSGYGSGQLAQGLKGAAASTGGWGSALSHPGAFLHNVGASLNPSIVRSGSALGGIGSVGSAAGSIVPHIGGGAANAGGSMGALSDFMGPVKGFLGNFDYGGGNLLGDAAKFGLNYYGQQSALNQQQDAADRAFANSQFTPYNISTPGGSATFKGTNASASLSPAAQKLLGNYNSVMGQDLTAFNKFSPQNYSQNMYTTLSNLKAPDVTAANNNLLSDVYNRGQWGGTVGAQDIYSADMANNLQDQALRLQSQQAGASESDRLFNQYMKSAAAYHSLLNSPNEFIGQGINAGGARSGANTNANMYPWLAASNSADASAAFWGSLGNTVGNYSNNINNNAVASNAARTQYRSTMTPGGYFVDMPV